MKRPKLPADRNPFALHAKKRKGGVMSDKKNKRKSGKNKRQEIMKEVE